MNSYKKSTVGDSFPILFGTMGLAVILISVFVLFGNPILGLYPFGPKRSLVIKVERLYVDYSGGKDTPNSHYMVGTDQGVFECGNSWWLGIWNSDEIYSSLKQGESYRIDVKGRKMLNMIVQKFPGIIAVQPVEKITAQ